MASEFWSSERRWPLAFHMRAFAREWRFHNLACPLGSLLVVCIVFVLWQWAMCMCNGVARICDVKTVEFSTLLYTYGIRWYSIYMLNMVARAK